MTTAPFTLEQTQRGKSELGDYTEFYSHLAIQARRASRVALVACAVALISIVSAILAQLRPPILLRVQDAKSHRWTAQVSRSPRQPRSSSQTTLRSCHS